MTNRINKSFWAIQLWLRASPKLSNLFQKANPMDPNRWLQGCTSHLAFIMHQMDLAFWSIELWLRQRGESRLFVAHQASTCYWVVSLWLRQCVHYWSFLAHQVDLSLWAIDLWLRGCTTYLRLVVTPVVLVVTIAIVSWIVLINLINPKMKAKESCTIAKDWPIPQEIASDH